MNRWLPAYVGLGSNLEDPARQVRLAVQSLRAAPWVHSLQCSKLYGSIPLGAGAQPDYCNAVVAFLTPLGAEELLSRLREVENSMGREPARERWAPRRIDLDLLCLAEERRVTPGLTLPHAGIVHRNFVLYPLAELAPDLWLPGMGRVATLAGGVAREGVWLMGTVE